MRWFEAVRRAAGGRVAARELALVERVAGARSDDNITTAAADYLRKVGEAGRLASMANDAQLQACAAWAELVRECREVEAGGLTVRPDAFLSQQPDAARQSER